MPFPESELILNPDGSIYHLNLLPHQVASTIITVGDPARVLEVSKHFDSIEHTVQHREFLTHTGILRGKPLTVISTGIGTDNIDIVLTELDALVNIDFNTRETKAELTVLDIIRVGTTGSMHASAPIDSLLVSAKAIGFDNLMQFYNAEQTADELFLAEMITDYLEKKCEDLLIMPYVFSADKTLLQLLKPEEFVHGITLTAPGFYAPQGRILRGRPNAPKLLTSLMEFKSKNQVLTNFEMETSGIYGMARLLGHRAVSVSAVLANRVDNTFSRQVHKSIESMIEKVLNIIAL